MPLTSHCLQEFVEPVPVCFETATLGTVLDVVHQFVASGRNCSHLLLVDEQSQPVGVISLPRLLPYLLPGESLGVTITSIHNANTGCSPSQKLEAEITEPISVLSGHLSLAQFLPYLALPDQPHYVITTNDGQCLGLLDGARLLLFLIAQSPILKGDDALIPVEVLQAQILQQQQINRLAQQLRADPDPQRHHNQSPKQNYDQQDDAILEQRSPPIESGSSTAQSYLQLLFDLVEYLPLPLMLQTSSGLVLAQNAVWQQQVHDLLDPDQIQQQAAAVLESVASETGFTSSGHADWSDSGRKDASTDSPAQFPAYPDGATTNLCQVGSKPNACICTCTLKDGREQVLQLLKIPLDNPLLQLPQAPSHPSDSSSLSSSLPHPSPHPQFHLATILSSQATPVEALDPSTRMTIATASTSVQLDRLWLILAEDVTEQHHLARELTAKNADLVQLNRLKDEFLACISHELRTPLTAVLGLSSLLKDQTLGEMTQRQVHYAQLIYQSGRHLMAVVNDILDLTRMETGQLELVPAPVNISAVCNRAFEQATQAFLADSRTAIAASEPELPPFSLEIEADIDFLIADEQRLRQMLAHLLSNALKFTQPEGQIGLRVNSWGGWIAFTIWDTGIGIPAEKQHLVFQKFQQLENPLTRQFEGTGLGLVLTQRLARLHGGDVTFLSKEGEGSQFTILLPPSPPAKTNLSKQEEFSPALELSLSERVPTQGQVPPKLIPDMGLPPMKQNRLVLIVEVVLPFIEALSEQLMGLGYRIVVARSGPEALEKARRLQPCIIFLNPVLPLLSGWDVLTLLKSAPETKRIPVAVTATKVEEQSRRDVDGWLNLPVQAKALRRILRQLVTETHQSPSPLPPVNSLTVLHLKPTGWNNSAVARSVDLSQFLQFCHYRVLEADDLDQAELLARVWKPNVVLLDDAIANPVGFLHQLSQHAFLASLPLVTLNQEITQAANQIPGLLVFPCLALPSVTHATASEVESSALLQAIQIAAGYAWRPTVLVVDIATLALPLASNRAIDLEQIDTPNQVEWLQALIQYLQTAGLRGHIGHSWQEVMQQFQSQTVDLLLICLTESTLEPETMQMLVSLQHLEVKPPILVLDHRCYSSTDSTEITSDLLALLQPLTSQIIPPDLSMADLLVQIDRILGKPTLDLAP